MTKSIVNDNRPVIAFKPGYGPHGRKWPKGKRPRYYGAMRPGEPPDRPKRRTYRKYCQHPTGNGKTEFEYPWYRAREIGRIAKTGDSTTITELREKGKLPWGSYQYHHSEVVGKSCWIYNCDIVVPIVEAHLNRIAKST